MNETEDHVPNVPLQGQSRASRQVRWLLVLAATLIVLLAATVAMFYACVWVVQRWNVPSGWRLWTFAFGVAAPLVILHYIGLRAVLCRNRQFGNRMVLAATTVCVIAAAFVGQELRQQRAIGDVMRYGGQVRHSPFGDTEFNPVAARLGYDPLAEIRGLSVNRDETLGALIRHHSQFQELSAIEFNSTSDAAFHRVGELSCFPELNFAEVYCPRLTDRGLAYLSQWKNLRGLNLDGCVEITDKGLRHLTKLPRLERLLLQGTWVSGQPSVSDQGFVQIARLHGLTMLHLSDVAISDAGLMHLKALRKLRYLGLFDTRVTIEGLQQLAAALPRCQIHCDLPEWRQSKPAID